MAEHVEPDVLRLPCFNDETRRYVCQSRQTAQKLLACNLGWSENPLTCCDNYDISQPLKLISLSRIRLKAVLDELSGSNTLCLFPCPVCACVCVWCMYDTAVVFRNVLKQAYS